MSKYKYNLPCEEQVETNIKGVSVNHSFFVLSPNGLLIIRKGYSWDGMTMYPDDATTYLASLYHDCLYQMIQLGLLEYKYKSVVDKLLLNTLIRDGHPKIKALIVYIGVSFFGGYFTKSK